MVALSSMSTRNPSPVVQSEPHSLLHRICPFYPMSPMGRDMDVIARLEHEHLGFICESQSCAATQQHDPFLRFLIVPFSWGRGLSSRGNAF